MASGLFLIGNLALYCFPVGYIDSVKSKGKGVSLPFSVRLANRVISRRGGSIFPVLFVVLDVNIEGGYCPVLKSYKVS